MNKKKILSIIGLVIAFQIIPVVFATYLHFDSRKTYHRYLIEDTERCFEKADRDKFPDTICSEMADRATEAYRSATENELFIVLVMTVSILGLGLSVLGLKAQLDGLKEKLDA